MSLFSTSVCFPRKWKKNRNDVKSIFSVNPPLLSHTQKKKPIENIFTADKCFINILTQ